MAVADCTDNLEKCKASCCRWLSFNLNSFPNDRNEDYYRKHGCVVRRIDRNMIEIGVPSVCAQLDENNHCKLHGTKQKPLLCVLMNEESVKTGRYYKTEGCMFYETKKEGY
jgi:hypothetical protein